MRREREGRRDSTHYGSNSFDGLGAQRSIFGGRDPFDDPFFTRPFDGLGAQMSNFGGRVPFGDPFFTRPFDGLGAQRINFGARDPFGDPFFTRPFGTLFDSSAPSDSLHTGISSQPLIQELDSDYESETDEKQEETSNDTTQDKYVQSRNSSKEPIVEHPDDQDNEVRNKDLQLTANNYNQMAEMKPHSKNVSFQKVTYGGTNGTYYTASTSRRTAGDGVVLEESKQADTRTGEATHRISKGIRDKGHTLTRKLDADGRVDTMQTLHNLNEDELANFHRDWRGNIGRNLPTQAYETSSSGNPGSSGNGGWGFPANEFLGRGRMRHGSPSESQPKKVFRINIE